MSKKFGQVFVKLLFVLLFLSIKMPEQNLRLCSSAEAGIVFNCS